MIGREEELDRELSGLQLKPGEKSPDVKSPMPGTVIAVGVVDGQQVQEGDVLVTIEAMKMEHPMRSPGDGTVRIGHLRVGDLVKAHQVVATVTNNAASNDGGPDSPESLNGSNNSNNPEEARMPS